MSDTPSDDTSPIEKKVTMQGSNILGLSTDELAGLSVEELTGNSTAITMLVHYYKQLVDENNRYKNDLNTLKTYVDGYSRKRTNAAVGGIVLAMANVPIGFGVNLLTTGEHVWPGLGCLIPGLVMVIVGLFFAFRESA